MQSTGPQSDQPANASGRHSFESFEISRVTMSWAAGRRILSILLCDCLPRCNTGKPSLATADDPIRSATWRSALVAIILDHAHGT